MQLRIVIFLLILLIPFCSSAQNGQLSGVIYDSVSKAPLAFVSIVVKETKAGIVTDIDGHFSIEQITGSATLLISYIGYKSKRIVVEKNLAVELSISLQQAGKQLETVVVSSGENPAHRIIRLLQKNKKKNDPEQQPYFTYNAYTIAALASGQRFWNMNRKDSNRINQQPDIPIPQKIDTIKNKQGAEIARRFKENYLMLTESYTQRIFRYPNQTKETVLATKVSGIKTAAFAVTGSNFQPFGFYKDYLEMNNIFYTSPVIDGSIGMYRFKLADIIPHEKDTTFVISFEPGKGKNFNGLKGVIYINSDGYAIENVIASPAVEKGLIFSFRIQQKYEKVKDQWFPVQFNSTLSQKDLKTDSVLLYWDSRCYISNVDINKPVPRTDFSNVQLEYHPLAGKRPDTAWIRMRSDSLNEKQRLTYETYDMLPAKYKNLLGKATTAFQLLAIEAIPWGKIDIPFKYILSGINKYETFRIGAGFQTSTLLSKFITVGGFAGYGLRDKAWKYGGNLSLNFNERTGTTLRLNYARDIAEPGNVDYFVRNGSVFSNQLLRNFQTFRMDSVAQLKIDISTRLRPSLQLNAWLMNEDRSPAGYDYEFRDDITKVTYRRFHNTEMGFGLRLTRGESFVKMGRAEFRSKPATTQLLFQLSKGLNGFWNGELDYTKVALQFNHSFRFKKIGVTTFQLETGKLWGNVPYSYLFNTKASHVSSRVNVYIPNTFQTAGLYEFVADQTVSLFMQHNFGNLLFKPNNLSFRPEILFIQNITYGSLTNAVAQKHIVINVPEKGLFESGLLVKNLYRRSIYSVAYLGFGGGVFYRYGYYSLPKAINNWAFKWGFSISF